MSEHEFESQEAKEPVQAEANGWLGRLIGVLARLFLVAILGIALGIGLYIGVPALLQAWMEPVEANTARIEQMEADLERLQNQQQQSLEGLSARVAALEGQTTAQQETLSELNSQIATLEEELVSVQGSLDEVDGLSAQVGDLEQTVAEQASELEALAEAEGEPSDELQALQDRIDRLQAMTLISRARLELLQSNFGLAQENLEQARASFDDQLLGDDSPILAVLERLDLAIQALPDTPSVAAQDLEAAWRLLAELEAADASN